MLVLSRHTNQDLVFPTLGITVRVLHVEGNRVRLGIDAPDDVAVHRREVAEAAALRPASRAVTPPTRQAAGLTHGQRNRLNHTFLALSLLQKQLDAGNLGDARARLSFALRSLEELEQEAAHEAEAAARTAAPPARRALVVEDDDNERELLAGYLRLSGFDVETAEDGGKALERLRTRPRFDVVLLDMLMPRLDGPATIQNIRGNPHHGGLKVFAVSGQRPEQCGVRVGHGGVDRWFHKPLNPRHLVCAMRETCPS
jgi:carbon storage regulator CsrA